MPRVAAKPSPRDRQTLAPRRVEPLTTPVEAKPHRPVYRMHRYYARRPYSVFARLVNHYCPQGGVVLDPFLGGGVTAVEAVLQGRRAIGFDLNPLAVFISEMELDTASIETIDDALRATLDAAERTTSDLFHTRCRKCKQHAQVLWFESSYVATCGACEHRYRISDAKKVAAGRWQCPACNVAARFSPGVESPSELVSLHYECSACGVAETAAPDAIDVAGERRVDKQLTIERGDGLPLPSVPIPDCNMQRESALHKKGVTSFEHLFAPRHLLALGRLKAAIRSLPKKSQRWALFAFSSTLRYCNRMVTRNAAWRADRPLEWAKPGFWLPPVYLVANVHEELRRRCAAILKGKRDYLSLVGSAVPPRASTARAVLAHGKPAYHVSSRSSTNLPLPDRSIDLILTDPPYGSYVHYADLSNFWSAWLPEVDGLGGQICDTEEAVIARKRFPGAKDTHTYQRLLERCFHECARVLKPEGYMVLTFNNREPRAWAALLVAAAGAGFRLPRRGVVFQDGIQQYKHTAQSRRAGSVIGDFVFSFVKSPTGEKSKSRPIRTSSSATADISDFECVECIREVLAELGPLAPTDLLAEAYLRLLPTMVERVASVVAAGRDGIEETLAQFDGIRVLDSHRQHLLREHFDYAGGRWSLRAGS